METVLLLLGNFGTAAKQLLLSPYMYASLFIVAVVYRRHIRMQRKLFFVRFHSFLGEWWRTVIMGVVAGLLATIVLFFGDASIQIEIVPVLWIVALILMIVRLRFVCFAYAVGMIAFMKPVITAVPSIQEQALLSWLVDPIVSADIYSLLLLVGILHLVESFLVRKQGVRGSTPMFFMSKRGKLIGGYQFQRFWPIPLLCLVPMTEIQSVWSVWSDPKQLAALVLMMAPFPVMIGFSDISVTQLPRDKVISTANRLFLYAIFVIGLAVLVRFVQNAEILAGLLTIIGHELLRWITKRKESKLLPLYTNSSLGLKVLAVLPGSAAEKLGIVAGETIHKVNGFKVHSRQQMYEAMTRNSAYCKLEVFNLEGQIKFLNRAVFDGEHHQLGVILAPDEDVKYYAQVEEYSLLSYLRLKLVGVFKKDLND